MVVSNVPFNLTPTLTSQQVAALADQTNLALLKIIRDNFTTQYASQACSLAGFRDAVSAHGGTEVDDTLLTDFRTHVPLSDYDSYKSFIDKFDVQPCREEDVLNMFSPGLPDFFALSSGTSGGIPKILPKYNHNSPLGFPTRPLFDPDSKYPLAAVVCTGYRDVKMIERAPGEVVQRIPVCLVSGGSLRRALGWYTDDESRMSLSVSGYAVPLAATVIGHFPSFLIIHGLFFLARRDVDLFLCTVLDTAQLHPNPSRAAELLAIGPPFSFEGWFARVWPNTSGLVTICSGPFATALPKVHFGTNCLYPLPLDMAHQRPPSVLRMRTNLDEFVLQSDDIIEFLDLSLDATHENIRQPWDVEVGRYYEPILTTRDGLWRYRLGDVVCIIGFDPESNFPIFKYSGRRTLTIRIPSMQITDDQLLTAIQTLSSDDTIQVQEFTTALDDRMLLPAVGFFVELGGPLGPNAHLARQKLFDALVATNIEHKRGLEQGKIHLPTIRIVKAGTFAEYRHWKGESSNIASGQIKLPAVLLHPTAQEWILERVVQEL
ncbi:GH3 auxin-responsive promoter-domain-containing protein [Boletus coccyginus]|nr:GH3 auxin-responsive promoter-domain-containing protein [Boletus coccyginus]